MKKEIMSWEMFDGACDELVKMIKKDRFHPQVVFTIPNGGLPLATVIANKLGIKVETDLHEVQRNYCYILVVDDVADTGDTLLNNYPRDRIVKIATLYYKPCSKVKPNYYIYNTDKWIVFPWEKK